MSHDREDCVETSWRNLLVSVNGGNASDGFTSNDAFTFSTQDFNGVFLENLNSLKRGSTDPIKITHFDIKIM